MKLFSINIPIMDLKGKSIYRIDPGRPAIFLPVFDIILDRYHGYVINKKAMPEIKEADIWDITKIVAPQLDTTKKDRFWKIMLAIPFLPVILILLLITKLFKKLAWMGFRFNRFIAELYNFLKGNKPEYWTHRQRKPNYPGAVLENFPAFME